MVIVTKTDKLLRALSSGKNIRVTELERRTGLANISSTVHRLNASGEVPQIYCNTRVNKRTGVKENFYRMAV